MISSRKNQKMPGAHKIGAAISGPRIAGGNFMDIRPFLSVATPAEPRGEKKLFRCANFGRRKTFKIS